MEASLLYTTMAFVPIPPEVEKTWSENEAFSITVRVCVCVIVCVYTFVHGFVCTCVCS